MAAAFARAARGAAIFGAGTLLVGAGKPKENRQFRASDRPERHGHAVLREAPKTLNVLLAGNALETPYLMKGGRPAAYGWSPRQTD